MGNLPRAAHRTLAYARAGDKENLYPAEQPTGSLVRGTAEMENGTHRHLGAGRVQPAVCFQSRGGKLFQIPK